MAERLALLLDTDIGSDIDDAVALAYLLRQPRAEIVGITTVTGDVQQRAALCEILCRAAGQADIPIHCGRRDVLWRGPGQPWAPQYEKVCHRPHRLDRPENTAVEFLRDAIRSRPGELVLLSVGPFSNIAALHALDPEVLGLLKGFVSMAGRFYPEPGHEWNCIVDPVATAIVAEAQIPGHLWVGLDVTTECVLDREEVRASFRDPLLEIVLEMAEAWFQQRPEITFHDPLAAALVFRPELCRISHGLVQSTLPDAEGRGGTTSLTPDDGPHRAAVEVDSRAFFEEFFSVFQPK